MAIRTIIIEDDPSSSALLQQYCNRTKIIALEASFSSGIEALSYNNLQDIDLILLDIEMPGMSGFEFLNHCNHQPAVIVISTKPQYAVEAFNYSVVDFLEKPFPYTRFQLAVIKAKERIFKQDDFSEPAPVNGYIFLKENTAWVKVAIDDILYFENSGDYVKVKTANRQYLIYRTMKSIMESLHSMDFMRIHRTYIINLNKIENIEEHNLLIQNKVIPIGKSHKSKLMQALPML